MNRPTRQQWRGYAVLCVLLFVALAFLLFRNCSFRHNEGIAATDTAIVNTKLDQAVATYGDSIIGQAGEERRNYRRRNYRDFGYDSSYHTKSPRVYTKKPQVIVELNSADTTALQQLYGIGPSFARRIVKYRSLLGGYVRKEQLLEVYGMTEDRYQAIAPYIIIDTSLVTAIDINSATVDQVRRHPYLDYYQARSVVDYRNTGFRFSSMKELLLVNLIDEKTVTNLEGYIQFN